MMSLKSLSCAYRYPSSLNPILKQATISSPLLISSSPPTRTSCRRWQDELLTEVFVRRPYVLLASAAEPPDTSSSPSTSDANKPPFSYAIGDSVLISGTGRWWSGRQYFATVTDIRKTDNTVKIRYPDGGYKRFPMSEFHARARPLTSADAERYSDYPLDLDVDQLTPLPHTVTPGILRALQTRISEAVYRKDFLTADQLKNDLNTLQSSESKLSKLGQELKTAVSKEEYKVAAGIQAEIESVQAERDKTVERVQAYMSRDRQVAVGDMKKEAEIQRISDREERKGGEGNSGSGSGSDSGGSRGGSANGKTQEDWRVTLEKSAKRALGGGIAGASAMAVQVCSLMWLRTIMNYQYRYGTSFKEAATKLYREGGIRRFYRGIGPALIQGPLSRFGDTASNVGALAFLNSTELTANLPVGVKTIAASVAATAFRITLMPIDTIKTALQVDGAKGIPTLISKFKAHGPSIFYHGALASSAATLASHYQWFYVYNVADASIPVPQDTLSKHARNAAIGFAATSVSDTLSNGIRVVKAYKQTHPHPISYRDAAKDIMKQDGVTGLLGRGLKTRILGNGMQGILFSVLWKQFDEKLHPPTSSSSSSSSSTSPPTPPLPSK